MTKGKVVKPSPISSISKDGLREIMSLLDPVHIVFKPVGHNPGFKINPFILY